MRIGFGYDSHRLVEGRKLIIGGIEISHEKGLLGNSDADVLLHAIADAIIGAMGEGDIGRHFPDTDPIWKDASSIVMLNRVIELTGSKGLSVHNLDSTVIAERPRLAPHIPLMREKIASVLGVVADRVNIKAKTNERMGFTGCEEGIAAYAVVMLREDAL
jgi:2-C-methyl-D-erythritol 2,4-cyclodiphosphate synthase